MDDTVTYISVHDAFTVSFNKHLVSIKYPERLRGLNLHQFVIPPGVDFPGVVGEEFTFRTGLASSTPLGWRLAAGNISDDLGQPGGWYVCELQPGAQGKRASLGKPATAVLAPSNRVGLKVLLIERLHDRADAGNTCSKQRSQRFQLAGHDIREFEANLAFDQRKSPGLYARSLKLQGKAGEVKPEVQFYVGGRSAECVQLCLWYTLQTFSYTEACVSLSSDFSVIFGNAPAKGPRDSLSGHVTAKEFDTVAPRILSSDPDLSSSLAVSTTQRISLVFSERIVPGSDFLLVDAGADGLCSTADDTVLAIPVDLPTAAVQNGTVPWVYITGETVLIRYPYQDMTGGNYHCLQVEPGIIQDLAGTPFPGLIGDDFRFPVATTPFQDATAPVFVATEPPSGTELAGLQIHSFKIFMSHVVATICGHVCECQFL
ncbi:unnamed protein product [Symbiodinium natans]|uniref:SbsA Ig-like domain-containing protein n=1 Tax=Symbiodinium natans TaxID=878477 RepID=A0A812KRI5_9DINO|nr:unnamed protein product [Symbiodinium natans]